MMFAPPAEMTETRTSILNGRKSFLKKREGSLRSVQFVLLEDK